MLNRHNAELELSIAIQVLMPAWNDESARYEAKERTSYLIDELLKILSDNPPSIIVKTDLSTRVGQLRRRLVNILAKEQDLNLDAEFCDTVFNIQLALAKLFPFNKEASDEAAVEAWEETFTMETITRETEDLIIFPESAVLTKASTQAYYQGQFSKDEVGNPRNFDNTLMSVRQLRSLQQQGITVAPLEFDDEEDFVQAPMSIGKRLGEKLGVVITHTAAIMMMILSRSSTFFWPGVLVGAANSYEVGGRGFAEGFFSTYLWGALANTLLVLGNGLVAQDADKALDFANSNSLALILPTIVFVAAVQQAYKRQQPVSDTFSNMTMAAFFDIPIKLTGKLGEFIEKSIMAIFKFIIDILRRAPVNVNANAEPASPSSHAIIIEALDGYPVPVLQAENPLATEVMQPVVINTHVEVNNNDLNNNLASLRPSF